MAEIERRDWQLAWEITTLTINLITRNQRWWRRAQPNPNIVRVAVLSNANMIAEYREACEKQASEHGEA